MSVDTLPTYTIYVEPASDEGEYIEASTDSLGHALRLIGDMTEMKAPPASGRTHVYEDDDIFRLENQEGEIIRMSSRAQGIIGEDHTSAEPDLQRLGWQILNSDGHSIHGDEDDPFDLPSFAILVGDAAKAARHWVAQNPGYSVGAVQDGDIEEPEFVSAVSLRAPTPR